MEDGDEVPETIESPQQYFCLRIWSLKSITLGLVLAFQNQHWRRQHQSSEKAFLERSAGVRESQADRLLC